MPDSNITKRALASALKELMEDSPFSKISVSDICQACDMNRKSFYYHFKDKYDLVNWIYYTECVAVLKEKDYCTEWELLEDLCAYFYKNRTFYRKTLSVDGQNSFSEYFRDILAAILGETMEFWARTPTWTSTWSFTPTLSSAPSSAGCWPRTACLPKNSQPCCAAAC